MPTPPATTSQTVGPYFAIGMNLLNVSELAGPGERFTLEGRVLDANRKPIPDALLEIWQANSAGKYPEPGDSFRGFGRIPTNENGAFRFTSIKPGPVPGPNGATQAPHLEVSVFMRGLLIRLTTRVYFPGEPLNATDPILHLVPASRRGTLIAQKKDSHLLHWDVLMQGDDETVFFDI